MAGSSIAQLCFNTEVDVSTYLDLSYGCRNFSEVLIEWDDDSSGAGAEADKVHVSIFAGTKAIVNRVLLSDLAAINQFEAGTGNLTSEAICSIDTGTYYLEKGDELIVKIDGAGITGGKKGEISVFAVVNGVEAPSPKRFMLRNDNAFLSEATDKIYMFGTALDESDEVIELGYGSEIISQPVSGLNAKTNSETVGDDKISTMCVLYDGLPRDIQVNYGGADTFRFLCLSDPPVMNRQLLMSWNHIKGKLGQMTAKERRSLNNRD